MAQPVRQPRRSSLEKPAPDDAPPLTLVEPVTDKKDIVHRIKQIGQPRSDLCWEACARIVYEYNHQGKMGFYGIAVRKCMIISKRLGGLPTADRKEFYKLLKMHPRTNLMDVLRSPLICMTGDASKYGHALVLFGWSSEKNAFLIHNPGGGMNFSAANPNRPPSSIKDSQVPEEGNGTRYYRSESDFKKMWTGEAWGY